MFPPIVSSGLLGTGNMMSSSIFLLILPQQILGTTLGMVLNSEFLFTLLETKPWGSILPASLPQYAQGSVLSRAGVKVPLILT